MPSVIRQREHGVVAIITYERNVLARSITCRIGVLSPEHRNATLALLGPLLLEEIGRAMGAELAYYFATLKTRHQQVIAERRGFQLVGIVPGHDRDVIAPARSGESTKHCTRSCSCHPRKCTPHLASH